MAHVQFLAGVTVSSNQTAWAILGALPPVCYYILAMQVHDAAFQ
jgi:hypothetical protein